MSKVANYYLEEGMFFDDEVTKEDMEGEICPYCETACNNEWCPYTN